MKYTVQRGDTLSKIAKMFNVTVEALVASNGIKDRDHIYVGQVLTIPEPKPSNNQVYNALVTCLDAIEAMPEFKTLMELMSHG